MNISEWPIRKPLAIFAALLVGISVGCCLYRGSDLPDNLTTLIQWFGGLTILAYYTSSTTEAVKGVTAYESNYTGAEREYMENDAAGGSDYPDTGRNDGLYESSSTVTSTVTADGRRFASDPRGFIGKYPKGRKHLR